MRKHAAILAPKFDAVDDDPRARARPARASRRGPSPQGGYFVSLDVLDGCAPRVVALAKEAGVEADQGRRDVPATASDPRDRNIRLAPTFPALAEVETAMAGVATCVALAAAERLADIG